MVFGGVFLAMAMGTIMAMETAMAMAMDMGTEPTITAMVMAITVQKVRRKIHGWINSMESLLHLFWHLWATEIKRKRKNSAFYKFF